MQPIVEHSDDENIFYDDIVAARESIISTLGNIMRRARHVKSEQKYYKVGFSFKNLVLFNYHLVFSRKFPDHNIYTILFT